MVPTVMKILLLAHKLELSTLEGICNGFVKSHINLQNVWQFLNSSVQYRLLGESGIGWQVNFLDIKDLCLHFLANGGANCIGELQDLQLTKILSSYKDSPLSEST